MNEEIKPSSLLSLPPELWHQIMRTTDDCLKDNEYTYPTLRHAALAHRILQPYAQEELLRMLVVNSQRRLITLIESLEGSSRLAEYAKRTELISLLTMGEEEADINELHTTLFAICYNTKRLRVENMAVRLSTIGKSSAFKSAGQNTDLENILGRLTKLRDLSAFCATLYADKPTVPFARVILLDLEETHLVDETGNECDLDLVRSLFSPAQFPALRQMYIDDEALEGDPIRFNLLLPQLSDVELNDIPLPLVAIQLPHCTSLKTLRLHPGLDEQPTNLLPFFNSLRSLNLERFHYWDGRRDDWESSLRDVRGIMAIVGEMKTLKKLSLAVLNLNDYSDVGKEWTEFKGEVRKICQKNKVKMIRYSDDDVKMIMYDDDDETLDRHELTWVD
jgi:hypothetical protein